MLKTFSRILFDKLVRDPKTFILSSSEQATIFERARRVRSSDYVLNLDVINGVCATRSVVTRSNWHFVLTNAAVYWDPVPKSGILRYPRVSIEFPMYSPSCPFNSEVDDLATEPSRLCFACEGIDKETIDAGKFARYEEERDILYSLGKTFVINVYVKAVPTQYVRGHLLLSGLEIDTEENA